jgi:hypothetical protein
VPAPTSLLAQQRRRHVKKKFVSRLEIRDRWWPSHKQTHIGIGIRHVTTKTKTPHSHIIHHHHHE